MKFILLLLLLFAGTVMCLSASSQQKQPAKQMDLYLLIGQSNMAGRGVITAAFAQQGSPQVYMLTKDNEWVPAKHPLHFDKPAVVGVGPGLSFGIAMSKANPGHTIGLIPCAVGGSSINVWQPGAYDSATHTHPYDDMMTRLQQALGQGVLKGIIWHQGESDSDSVKAIGYLQKLIDLITRLRKITAGSCLPFVAGEIGRYNPHNANINNQLHKLQGLMPCTAVASSEGLTSKEDHIHFTAGSADTLGLRFADQLQKLQAQQ